jgi:hypothetical protein
MRPQKAARINQEATKRDVDKWMEDLLVRIQLRIMHPHSVIDQDGTAIGEDRMVVELEEA